MHNRCAWLFVVLTISWQKHASTYTVLSNNNLLSDLPTKSCPSDGVPVCGERNQQLLLFPNDCLLKEANKDLLLDNTSFKKVSLKYCLNGCQFLCSKMYQPICGKNMKTGENKLFANKCEVMKYTCQTSEEYNKVNLSECRKLNQLTSSTRYIKKREQIQNRLAIPCTNTLKPVCGIYMGVKSTFRNECLLNEENVKFNRDWRIVKQSVCAEDYTNTRQKKEESIKPHLIKKRSLSNNFNDIHNEYNTKNFENHKISSNLIPNNLYIYMPADFQTQYLNYDDTNYHQSISLQKAYDEIYNKIIALPEIQSEHDELTKGKTEEQNNYKELFYKENVIKPVAFRTNGMHFNYLPDVSQSISEANSLSIINSEISEFISGTDSGYHSALKTQNNDVKSEKETTTIATTMNLDYTWTTYKTIPTTTILPKDIKNYEKDKENKCKFGLNAICGVMANGTVQSFDTVCEMMTANINLKNAWVKLHDGVCETCTFNCSREYKPICVTRNGVNYTMINDCYFNMGICMDKKSKWKKLSEGECERYTRIPDKYAYSKPGFFYTSDYFASDMTSTTEIYSLSLPTTTEKLSELKSHRNKKPRPNSKRAINKHFGLCRCSPRTRYYNCLACDNVKCRCGQTTTTTRPTRLSLHGPQTESYIMRLVKDKAND